MSGQVIGKEIMSRQRRALFVSDEKWWSILKLVAIVMVVAVALLLLFANGSMRVSAAEDNYGTITVANDGTASEQIIIPDSNGMDAKYLTVPADGLYAISTRGSGITMTLYVYKDDKGAVCETDFVITSQITDSSNLCESVVYLRKGYIYVLSLEKENGGRAVLR